MAVIEPTAVAQATAGAAAVPRAGRTAGNGVIVAYLLAVILPGATSTMFIKGAR